MRTRTRIARQARFYGNIVSEWGQLLALIVVTKGFREAGSKESWSVLHIGESASLSAERGSLG